MDLELIENGDGGDLIKNPNDLSVIYGFENMIFLALFGGNMAESTPTTRNANEQDFSFWGNNLLMANDSSIQFNSETERSLKKNALNSYGRSLIEQAVISDLAFLNDFATVDISVTITGVDRIEIGVKMQEPDRLQKQEFIFIWDATNKELMGKTQINYTPIIVTDGIFDQFFDDSFE